MTKLALLAVSIAALAAAGVAVAHGTDGGGKVAATFTATAVTGSTARTCKTITSTSATYTGTASGSPDLNGKAVIAVRSAIETAAGVGIVTGTLRVGKTNAHLSAVYDHGAIAGTASGPKLLANVSAAFNATTGFTNGKIGGGTAGGSAIERGAGCDTPKSSQGGREATGTITAVNAGSITIGKLTCSVPTSLAITVSFTYAAGTRAQITCALVSGVLTLVRIEAKK